MNGRFTVKAWLGGLGLALLLAFVVLLAVPVALDLWGPAAPATAPAVETGAARADRSGDLQVARGAYLARAGHCAGCHTAPGGAPYAGGRGIDTPFGTVYASNLTPDATSGLGRWSADDFWQALHHGRSRDGRLLAPAFPYPNYTEVQREDADALFAYLRSLPPVAQRNRAQALRFPYGTPLALAVWRRLYFRPGVYQPDAAQSAAWNRGAYLVRGLGHCAACHSPRNTLGAPSMADALAGGLLPMQRWYAPSLLAPDEAGVQRWPLEDVVDLLQSGVSAQGGVLGPMAEVVWGSTQHLTEADLRAMAIYLRGLPEQPPAARPARKPDETQLAAQLRSGGELYGNHCASCHGKQGEGAPGAYPALAGNRTVLMQPPLNAVRAVLLGGYPPATAGNPRPYGMPPLGQVLNDREIAAVLTYTRQAWGNQAAPVSAVDVQQAR
ncbi:MAG: cytochrome c [Burkholderiales bacterium]